MITLIRKERTPEPWEQMLLESITTPEGLSSLFEIEEEEIRTMFLNKGFRVLPAGWKDVDATKALILNGRREKDPNMLGHLFTTWSGKRQWLDFAPLTEGLKLLQAITSAKP